VTVAGFDLTFCAPKSVSLLHGLAEPELAARVQAGHERSVEAALDYLQEHALAVRRRASDVPRIPEPAEAVPAAAFVHRTSRALDPHLHTHVLLANVARGPDGSWSALDGRGVYAHASAAGALYQAQLRHELTASTGVVWGPLAHGRADIAGIGPDVRAAFSRRAAEIAAHLHDRGLVAANGRVSRRAARVASLATRSPKDLAAGAEELRPWWRERASALGLGPRRLDAVLDRVSVRTPSGPAPDGEARAVADALVAQHGADRPFARRHVVRAWSSALAAGAPAAEVAAVVDRFLDEIGPELPRAGPSTAGVRRDAPGVGERRMEMPERLRRREIEVLLERRGMAPVDRSRARQREQVHALGIDLGLG
jgi:conjugative relaxase-like TrwC/TraI family protein